MSGKRSQSNASKAMKEELLKWICMSHATNSPLNRSSLRTKALELVNLFGLKGFKCSEAWITVFLKRYGFSTNFNECSGPVFEDYRLWIDLIRPLLMEYNHENQFHVDELMMYTDFLPSVTGVTPTMNRVTLLLACNISGTEKLRPLICGPYNLKEHQDRLYYQADNSKISDKLFSSWLLTLNRDMAFINRNIVLLMSRKRVNVLNNLELTHIMPLLMPNEYPAKLKPFRTDIFHYIKMSYRREYVELLCKAPSKALWDPEEIIDTLIESWKAVSRELIVTNFQRTKFREDDSFLNIECESWNNLMTGVPFEKFVSFDDDLIDITDTGLNNLAFLSSIKENDILKSSFSHSSRNNDDEQSEISTGDLDESLKRPSDDSLDMSGDLQGQSCDETADISSLQCQELNNENSDQHCSTFHSIEGLVHEKSLNTEKRVENISVRGIDTLRKTKSSPTRSVSTTVEDYSKEINRHHVLSKRTPPVLQTYSKFINDGCFEEVTNCLETRLVTLEKNYYHPYADSSGNNSRNFLNSSPIPSTSKEGLEESYLLQQLHERFREVNFYDKVNANDDNTTVNINNLSLEKNNQRNEEKHQESISFKRKKRDDSIDIIDEPGEKKLKVESNWAKQYENHPVFGPDTLQPSRANLDNNSSDISFEAQEIEKKCIFSFSQSPKSPESC